MLDGWLVAERFIYKNFGRSYGNVKRKHPIYGERDTPLIDTCCIYIITSEFFFRFILLVLFTRGLGSRV